MKVERVNVTNQIIDYLIQNIDNGNWQEGEKIPSENQLTKELGVSRASVRTAIQHLTGIGVLESIHGKGTYLLNGNVEDWGRKDKLITAKDCQDIAKVLEFRRIVEPEACYLAAMRGVETLPDELEKYLTMMKSNQGNQADFVEADMKFHEAICLATDNPILEKTMSKVFVETKRFHEKMNDIFGYQEGIRYHTLLTEAFRRKDAVLAKELMYEHLQNGIEQL